MGIVSECTESCEDCGWNKVKGMDCTACSSMPRVEIFDRERPDGAAFGIAVDGLEAGDAIPCEFANKQFQQGLKRSISLACSRAYRAGARDNAAKIRDLLQINQTE
jgi:hypothetical protein